MTARGAYREPFKGNVGKNNREKCLIFSGFFFENCLSNFKVFFDVFRHSGGSWSYSESVRTILEIVVFVYF